VCSSRFTVAIVEDDDAVRDSLRTLLDSHGLTVRAYASPRMFLESGEEQDAHCLVFDLHMPEMTGLELAEKMRARAIVAPIIIVTGRTDPVLGPRMRRANIAAVLPKPVSGEDLMAWLERIRDDNFLSSVH
jgi:two-component system, LuxR family, response regulator FixJ